MKSIYIKYLISRSVNNLEQITPFVATELAVSNLYQKRQRADATWAYKEPIFTLFKIISLYESYSMEGRRSEKISIRWMIRPPIILDLLDNVSNDTMWKNWI
jgi:hypothetical protein